VVFVRHQASFHSDLNKNGSTSINGRLKTVMSEIAVIGLGACVIATCGVLCKGYYERKKIENGWTKYQDYIEFNEEIEDNAILLTTRDINQLLLAHDPH
jgi:hypothetical protein